MCGNTADAAGTGAWASNHWRFHLDPAAHERLYATLSLGVLLWPADLLHDHLPGLHRAPIQQILPPGKGPPQVRCWWL